MKATSALMLMVLTASQSVLANDMSLSFGGFFSKADATGTVTGNGFGEIGGQEAAPTGQPLQPFTEFTYHFADRHTLYLEWKRLQLSTQILASNQPFALRIDGSDFTVRSGGQLNTSMKLDSLRLGYNIDVLQGNDYRLGFTLGIHTLMIETLSDGVFGAGLATGLDTNVSSQRPIPRHVTHDVAAPSPDLGLNLYYQLLPGWQLSAHAHYLYLGDKSLEGALTDIRAGLNAELGHRWHLSMAYNYYRLNADISQKIDQQLAASYQIGYRFIGPMIAVGYRF